MTEHVHTWNRTAHSDGCHAYETIYACFCGAERHVGAERDVSDEDPWSFAFWLDQDCSRCKELLEGAEPESWDQVVEV